MTLTYQFGDKLYLNITNRCTCACEFCIREGGDGVGDGDNLWLEREPTGEEVIADLKKRDLTLYTEVVFCGYGEPTESLDALLEIAKYLKSTSPEMPIRLNTNGLAELSNEKPVAELLKGLIDIISISLNAPDRDSYQSVTHSVFGTCAFDAMLKFATECKEYIPTVQFTVVDIITHEEIRRSQELADSMGIPLRVREKI